MLCREESRNALPSVPPSGLDDSFALRSLHDVYGSLTDCRTLCSRQSLAPRGQPRRSSQRVGRPIRRSAVGRPIQSMAWGRLCMMDCSEFASMSKRGLGASVNTKCNVYFSGPAIAFRKLFVLPIVKLVARQPEGSDHTSKCLAEAGPFPSEIKCTSIRCLRQISSPGLFKKRGSLKVLKRSQKNIKPDIQAMLRSSVWRPQMLHRQLQPLSVGRLPSRLLAARHLESVADTDQPVEPSSCRALPHLHAPACT